MSDETYLVDTAQAAKKLGVSRTYIAALKKAVGCGGSHRFKLSWLTDYLDENPNFRVRGNKSQGGENDFAEQDKQATA